MIFQARLLDDPGIVDALPLGGQVRFVCEKENETCAEDETLRGVKFAPTEPRFEDGFMVLLHRGSPRKANTGAMEVPKKAEKQGDEAVVEVHNLVKKFGDFTAVDHVNFEVHRGEIFGLLGPNGAGKTTTFRMLCGLLSVTDGALRVAGADLRHARASARQRLGYVAQKFSLYGQLTVAENLDFFAGAYSLRGEKKRQRIDWAMQQFELKPLAKLPSAKLPGGYKQRLAMAAALLHEPEILFLDEPTSGADPPARREFWRRITALAQQGVTVLVTTHFMDEAEYCDHIAIMDSGCVLAQGRRRKFARFRQAKDGKQPTMEDAFIAIVEKSRESASKERGAA